jgi:hypothetical protein
MKTCLTSMANLFSHIFCCINDSSLPDPDPRPDPDYPNPEHPSSPTPSIFPYTAIVEEEEVLGIRAFTTAALTVL